MELSFAQSDLAALEKIKPYVNFFGSSACGAGMSGWSAIKVMREGASAAVIAREVVSGIPGAIVTGVAQWNRNGRIQTLNAKVGLLKLRISELGACPKSGGVAR